MMDFEFWILNFEWETCSGLSTTDSQHSWAFRFAGGMEGRSPGKVALHRRGSSQWGEKEVSKICGTASAWALLSHLIGCPLGERALPGLAFLGHPASRAGWKAAVRER